MKPVIYASTSPAISEREIKHCELARKICAEGIVLLENRGILPFKSKKIALYGAGARHTSFGGTGSGENNPRHCVNVEEGLKAAGLEIVSGRWLDEYDSLFEKEHLEYQKNLSKAMKKVPVAKRMDYAAANPFYLPAGRTINSSDTICDTAIYVLTRQAGEGSDRKDIPGDYYITEEEKELMLSITEHHLDTILVLNTGGVIDLKFLDSIKFSAVILLMQGGMETGNALADIIVGNVNPSGRLADTWADSYEDYPCSDTFSNRNPEKNQEDYREGIFVGYRWFDKSDIDPRYPFGYGLSYTEFGIKFDSVTNNGSNITVKASVTNTGKLAGREVLMLYLSYPDSNHVREVRSLAAFAKSSLLEPGESEIVTMEFDITCFASFDKHNSCFILEKGEYIVSLNGNPECIVVLDEDCITEIVKPMFEPQRKIKFIPQDKNAIVTLFLPSVTLSSSDITTVTHNYDVPDMERSDKIDNIISGLSLKDMSHLIVGRTYFGPFRHRVFGAVGYTTSKLFHKGVDAMPMADGPQGINLIRVSKKPGHNLFAVPTLPASIRKTHKIAGTETVSGNNRYYQFCTSWPCETLVAQTWDTDLAYQMGDAVGSEMKEYGVVFWLAPALNIHRNPLCGRNFEYYSEDPVLTGNMAASITMGVQSHEGCYVTLKHFAANNLETERNRSSSNLDEKTLREIYFKAFKIAVKKANPRSVMCSYNKINGIYTALDYNLQTNVLRNEWGFDGIVMTDWFATGHDESLDELCCKAGTDLIMPGTPMIPSRIRKALKKGQVSKEDIERSARRIIKLALESHTSRN